MWSKTYERLMEKLMAAEDTANQAFVHRYRHLIGHGSNAQQKRGYWS